VVFGDDELFPNWLESVWQGGTGWRKGSVYRVASAERANVEECVRLLRLEDLHRRDLTCAMVSCNAAVLLGPGKSLYP
jgi:hypothetical protein